MFVSELKPNINAQPVYFNLCKFPFGSGMKWEWILSPDFQDQIAVMIQYGLLLTVLPRSPIFFQSRLPSTVAI
jgi:hypothetical protein